MMCGAKSYIVEMETDGTKMRQYVTARTPAAARKTIRAEYGKETKITSVREGRRNQPL